MTLADLVAGFTLVVPYAWTAESVFGVFVALSLRRVEQDAHRRVGSMEDGRMKARLLAALGDIRWLVRVKGALLTGLALAGVLSLVTRLVDSQGFALWATLVTLVILTVTPLVITWTLVRAIRLWSE